MPRITGPLTIGDGIGGTNAGRRTIGSSEQIGTTGGLVVTIERSGLLDLNNFNETIANLELSGGNVATGTGVLSIVAGSNTGIVSNASAATAAIAGNVNLGNQPSYLTSQAAGLAVDVDIPAVISNGGINKAGLRRIATEREQHVCERIDDHRGHGGHWAAMRVPVRCHSDRGRDAAGRRWSADRRERRKRHRFRDDRWHVEPDFEWNRDADGSRKADEERIRHSRP
jgi:hypothetical protein